MGLTHADRWRIAYDHFEEAELKQAALIARKVNALDFDCMDFLKHPLTSQKESSGALSLIPVELKASTIDGCLRSKSQFYQL